MLKITKYPLIILFVIAVYGFAIADTLTPDKDYSDLENRVLAQRPIPSIREVVSNEFTSKYEEYIDDQILGRNQWIDLKSRAEFALMRIENNGIVYGKDFYMFPKYKSTNEIRLRKNVGFIKSFINSCKDPVVFGIIPSSYMKNEDKLPEGLENLNQYNYINKINSEISNVKNAEGEATHVFNLNQLDLKYYHTDHHWTTLGAYVAYAQMMKQQGLPIVSVEKLAKTEHVADGFYGTYFNKTKAFNAQSDQITYYDIPTTEVKIDGKKQDGIYDFSKLKTRDKYGMFLYGNHGITVIKSENNLNKTKAKTRVLLIKDSFGNCFAPFLTYDFDEVVVIDLRAIGTKLSDFLAQNRFDKVIVMYNFMNLAEDANVAKITF